MTDASTYFTALAAAVPAEARPDCRAADTREPGLRVALCGCGAPGCKAANARWVARFNGITPEQAARTASGLPASVRAWGEAFEAAATKEKA